MRLLSLILLLSAGLLFNVTQCTGQNTIEKDTISVETAKVKEIYRVGSQKLKKKEVKALLESDLPSLKKFRGGQVLNYTGITLCAAGAGVFLYAVGDAIDKSINTEQLQGGVNDKSSMNWTYFGAGIGAMIPGALMMILGKEQRVKAVRKYNRTVSGESDQSHLYIRPASRGVGLTLEF